MLSKCLAVTGRSGSQQIPGVKNLAPNTAAEASRSEGCSIRQSTTAVFVQEYSGSHGPVTTLEWKDNGGAQNMERGTIFIWYGKLWNASQSVSVGDSAGRLSSVSGHC